MARTPTAHTFLAYAPENEELVEAIAQRLHDDPRLSFWFRPWHSVPGRSVAREMQRELLRTQSCAVFVGGGAVTIEGWQDLILSAALQRRVEADPSYRVIPVFLPGATAPHLVDVPFLTLNQPVLFRTPDDERALRRLRAGILGVAPISLDRPGMPRAAPTALPRASKGKVVDAEINIASTGDAEGAITILCTPPDGLTVAALARGAPVQFDLAALREAMPDAAAYGRALAAQLFTPPVQLAWGQARAFANGAGASIRVRLTLDYADEPLQSLRWETLVDPLTDRPMAQDERLYVSRFLTNALLLPIRRPLADAVRVMAAVANPADIARFGLEALDVAGEIATARSAFGSDLATIISGQSQAAAQHTTLAAIAKGLRSAPHIFYLVCHGRMVDGEAVLFLEDKQGKTRPTPGAELVATLAALAEQPTLIILASCQSAGDGEGLITSALGPQLARAGIAAVIGFQGLVTQRDARTLLSSLAAELRRDAVIDRALAAARGVLDKDARGKVVLWLRLRDGRLW